MRTIRIKLYKFNELSNEAKQKAIQSLSDINIDYEWHDLTIEEKQNELSELGYEDAKILFSGFGSQGDGACFTCSGIDFNKFMSGKYAAYSQELSCSITHSYRYFFSTSTTVNLECESNSINDELYTDIENDIRNERERIGNEIYRTLEEEYTYLTSEQAIAETIEANEYEFTRDGKMQ